jgi:hypothetical protein
MNSFTSFQSWVFACSMRPSMLLLVSSSTAICTSGVSATVSTLAISATGAGGWTSLAMVRHADKAVAMRICCVFMDVFAWMS